MNSGYVTFRMIAVECIDFYQSAADMKGLLLNLAVAPGSENLPAHDVSSVRHIVSCLVSNAVKFTARGAIEIRLCFSSSGNFRIEIIDTGPGISDERRRRIFQDLHRADAVSINKTLGSGLGLSLSAEAARKMGCKLVHRPNPGGGSIFVCEFTKRPDSKAHVVSNYEVETESELNLNKSNRSARILLADDSVMHRDLGSITLEQNGHVVVTARSGTEVLDLLDQSEFDIILMDLRMPQMDGIMTTFHIRSREGNTRLIPILALTSQDFPEQVTRCRKAGMDGLISKPFDPDLLRETVDRVITLCKSRHGNERIPWIGRVGDAPTTGV